MPLDPICARILMHQGKKTTKIKILTIYQFQMIDSKGMQKVHTFL